jgi:hypothetical protein
VGSLCVHDAAAHDHQRDAASVPAGYAATADGVRGHPAGRRPPAPAARPVGVDPRAGHPPRRVRVGPRRARVLAGAVRGGAAPGVPAVRVGPAQLRRPGVRARRGQGRARHAARALPLRHLRRLPPRSCQRPDPPSQARRASPPPAVAAVRLPAVRFFARSVRASPSLLSFGVPLRL